MKLPGRTRELMYGEIRADIWKDAWIYLTAHGGGPVRSTEMAKVLGVEVRGLVIYLRQRSDMFQTQYRNATGEGKASATYILIAPKAIKEPAPIPEEHRSVLPYSTTGAILTSDETRKICAGIVGSHGKSSRDTE